MFDLWEPLVMSRRTSGQHNTTPEIESSPQPPMPQLKNELAVLRRWILFAVADLGGTWLASVISWMLFFLVAVVLPTVICILKYLIGVLCAHSVIVQVAHTLGGFIAFWSIRSFLRKHELREAFFLDGIDDERTTLQSQLVEQLRGKFKLFYWLVALSAASYACYRVYWLVCILPQSTPYKSMLDSRLEWSFLAAIELLAFTYRIILIFLASLLIQFHCIVQVLRTKEFIEYFVGEVNLMALYDRQKSLETQLDVISQGHQSFITFLLVIATTTQMGSLVIPTGPIKSKFTVIFELMLCTGVLWMALFLCLASSVQITHIAQSVKRRAVCWHARVSASSVAGCSTSGCPLDQDKKVDFKLKNAIIFDEELKALGERVEMSIYLLNDRMVYERRLAVLTYLNTFEGGMLLYGFVLDRHLLHALFMMQLSLLTWVLSRILGV